MNTVSYLFDSCSKCQEVVQKPFDALVIEHTSVTYSVMC